ncbi:MAG: LysM peptidoglycan-binding domain-containing protein [Saprospiraceae bacterium]|nr:LysM peptidoglycan-binding domain-containing protein [Saprospiraceae bacterium]
MSTTLRALPTFLLWCALITNTQATGDSLRYLLPKDTVFLTIEGEEKYFDHRLEKKQTLYSLSRFYGLSVEELYYYNPGLKEKSGLVGQAIRIPIPNRAIKRYKDNTFAAGKHASVYYVVKKGDTMFRICRTYFRMPMEIIMERNDMTSTTVKEGQRIHVGWISTEGVPESFRQFSGDPNSRRNEAMSRIYQREKAAKKEKEHQGVAYWQKNSKEDSDFYALHRHAPIKSVIAVTNPMSKRTVYVKVIGRIPDTVYGDDVVVVLSPITAKVLNAKDPRFFVRVKYWE